MRQGSNERGTRICVDPGPSLASAQRLSDFEIDWYATVETGRPFFLASACSDFNSVSVNITATRLRRESGEGPLPEPFGRPAPGRRPPQLPFFFATFLAAFFAFFFAAIISPDVSGWARLEHPTKSMLGEMRRPAFARSRPALDTPPEEHVPDLVLQGDRWQGTAGSHYRMITAYMTSSK